jgi:gentisate 1,2-dioxygenase
MAWLDGLDIPLVTALDAGFFQFGPDEIGDRSTPHLSRNERLWGHPGLRPIGAPVPRTSPLMAYRWEHTDAALRDQLALDAEGRAGALGPGHAAVRYTNPATGGDALVTLRMEMHRLAPGAATPGDRRGVGSAVWQVFAGGGTVRLDGREVAVARGDVVAVPSWCPVGLAASAEGLDLFLFSDAPVVEALGLTAPEGVDT